MLHPVGALQYWVADLRGRLATTCALPSLLHAQGSGLLLSAASRPRGTRCQVVGLSSGPLRLTPHRGASPEPADLPIGLRANFVTPRTLTAPGARSGSLRARCLSATLQCVGVGHRRHPPPRCIPTGQTGARDAVSAALLRHKQACARRQKHAIVKDRRQAALRSLRQVL
jgi:hypothetical protein